MFGVFKHFGHMGELDEEAGGSGPFPPDGLIAEDGVTFLVAEDGVTFLVQE